MFFYEELKSILKNSSEEVQKEISMEAESLEILRFILNQKELNTYTLKSLKKTDVVDAQKKQAIQIAKKRATGYPLQYLTHSQYFYHNEYFVDENVLIPRPETEVLVEKVAEFLKNKFSHQDVVMGFELGLGSGVISIELLKGFSNLKMICSEMSSRSIEVALKNYQRILGPQNGRFKVFKPKDPLEVLDPFFRTRQKAHFLVSNPPYLDPEKDEIQNQVKRYEPHQALFAAHTDPLYFYRACAEKAHGLLEKNGVLFFEIPHSRTKEIVEIFQKKSWETHIYQDYTQRDRVLFCKAL